MEFEIELDQPEPDPCRTCMGIHDECVHAATRNIREWLRSELNRKLEYRADFTSDTSQSPDLGALAA